MYRQEPNARYDTVKIISIRLVPELASLMHLTVRHALCNERISALGDEAQRHALKLNDACAVLGTWVYYPM